ncbi:hypothetical protein [Rhodococcus sp. IEGM1428]|uniref:hypothetical protein n=1 Tax=Rhodococcus sp. IEGM1428 TaxID=3392191 RepID=UPI003D0C8F9B
MRTKLSAALAAAAAIPLALIAATPATAAVGQVTAEFNSAPVSGAPGVNTVTGTFTFTGGAQPTACFMFDYTGAIGNGQSTAPGSSSVTVTNGVNVSDGTYTIEWWCEGGQTTDTDPSQYWGTPGGIPTIPGPGGDPVPGGPATATTETLVVPAVTPGCSGSVCLPTGSFFGF